MKRWLWALPFAVLALGGCDPKKPTDAPAPKTSATHQELKTMAASAPSSDPSVPSAAAVLAAQETAPAAR